MGMGMKSTSTSNALTKQLDATGKVKYDAIAKYGHAKDKVVHSKFQDLVPKPMQEEEELERPDDDAIRDVSSNFLFTISEMKDWQSNASCCYEHFI